MKITKIFAGMAAAAVAASMVAIPASAASDYLYLVQASWNGNAPTDSVEGAIKFQYDEDGNPVMKKGACDLNKWDTGAGKFNGEWAQYIFANDDLSSVSITFTIETTEESTWEYHETSEDKPEEDSYILFNVFTVSETINHDEVNGSVVEADPADGTFVHAAPLSWTYTYDSAAIQEAIDAGKAQFGDNGDGTYTLGFNIQVGHVCNALVTGEVTADNLYVPSEGGDESTGDDESKADDSKADDSKADESKTDSSSKATTTTTTTSKTTTTTTTSTATSDATENTSTGAAAGVGLAIAAVAGAAIVVSKRK